MRGTARRDGRVERRPPRRTPRPHHADFKQLHLLRESNQPRRKARSALAGSRSWRKAVRSSVSWRSSRISTGGEVAEHYLGFYSSEPEVDRAVTDWELKRYFERI